jgi:hypothetical protein
VDGKPDRREWQEMEAETNLHLKVSDLKTSGDLPAEKYIRNTNLAGNLSSFSF